MSRFSFIECLDYFIERVIQYFILKAFYQQFDIVDFQCIRLNKVGKVG